MKTLLVTLIIPLMVCLLVGCDQTQQPAPEESQESNSSVSDSGSEQASAASSDQGDSPDGHAHDHGHGQMQKMDIDPATVVFKDEVSTNVEPPEKISELVFSDKNGKPLALKDFLGKKNVVLVFTEGFFNGMLCPYCQTQTSRLIANYDEFQKVDTEILVVYPGKRDHLEEFVEAALKTEKKEVDEVPFPIVLDEDFAATEFFDIRSMHAHPSTFVIDKGGAVHLAYVGKDMSADRPSVKAVLNKLKSVNK